MPEFNPPIGEPPAVQFITCDRLQIDASYQRTTNSRRSQALIEAIALNWDWRLCVPLLVSAREGGLFIIDGQHRWEGARRRGDIAFLPCAVGQYAGAAEEAALFVAANRRRVAVHRVDLFRAALGGGDAETVKIDRLLTEAGLRLAVQGGTNALQPGEVSCTRALYRALQQRGEAGLSRALGLLGQAFAGQVMTFASPLLDALLAIGAFDRDLTDDELAAALSLRTANAWATLPEVKMHSGGAQRRDALRKAICEAVRAERSPAHKYPTKNGVRPVRSFEEQMELVASGRATIVEEPPLRRPDPTQTLGGVATGML